MPLREPLVCPVLVGRAEYMAALGSILKDAAAGSGRIVLVSGEAGIGKSRLLRELSDRCERSGWYVFQGNCFEQDRALPFSAWADLVRHGLAGQHKEDLVRALGLGGAEIVRLLPELAGLVPERRLPPALDAQEEKQRLFQAFERTIDLVSGAAPRALLVEDIHWADESTLELILHFARKAGQGRVLLVATYRSDEVGPSLGTLLAELDRGRLATEFVLDRLDPSEVHEMVRAILGPGVPTRPDLARSLYDLTEGNPFFIEEALGSGRAQAGARLDFDTAVPRTVQEAVRRRFRAVGDEARQAAEYAAVAGRRFDFSVLSRICGLDEARLLNVMKELVAAQLIVEESADQFAFRHALTREAVYSSLLTREKRQLHRRIAQVLEEMNPDSPERVAGDLGYHFFEAEEFAKSLHYARIAALDPQRMYAPRAAVEHFTRAITSAEHLSQSPPSELLKGRGAAFDSIGEFDKALADLERALQVGAEEGDPRAQWQALIDLGMLWAARDYARSGEYYKKAFALAESAGDDALIAHSMNRVGNWHINIEEPVEALHYHRQALALFGRLQDKRGIASTLDLLGMASYIGGDLVPGLAYYQQAVPLLRALDDRPGLISVLASMTAYAPANLPTQSMVPAPLTISEAISCNTDAASMAREIGWSAAESYALWNLSAPLESQGRYGEAIEAAHAGLAIAQEIGHRQWQAAAHIFLGAIYLSLLAFEEAEDHLKQAITLAEDSGSMHWLRHSLGLMATTLVEAGRTEEAASVLSPLLKAEIPARTVGERLVWSAAADLALAEGKGEEALAIVERLRSFMANEGKAAPGLRFSLLLGRALLMTGRPAEAVGVLGSALEEAPVDRNVGGLWRTLVASGNAYSALGREDQASESFERAARLVLDLLPNVPAGRREQFVSRVAVRFPSPRGSQLRQKSQSMQAGGGLTPRETTIALLIARGLSNRAIADELVLSERTVETHVSNILAKLGFSSRAQIAAWAVENKLGDAR